MDLRLVKTFKLWLSVFVGSGDFGSSSGSGRNPGTDSDCFIPRSFLKIGALTAHAGPWSIELEGGDRYKIDYSAEVVKSRCVAGVVNITCIINTL
jgi:hypothetical protein